MGRLQDKVVIITGAAQGIGKATAYKCGLEGAKLVISDYNVERLETTCNELRNMGFEVLAIPCDVSKEDQIKELYEIAYSKFSEINSIVNNAGIFLNNSPETFEIEDYTRITDINIKGVMLCIKHAAPYLKKSRNPSIVNLASISGLIGTPNHNLYIMTKHAVVGITRSSAVELSRYGIRVNAVCPGLIDTNMAQQLIDGDGGGEEVRNRYESAYLLGRLGRPEEVANVISFLASDEASFMTGAMVPVDSGYTAT